MQIPGRSAASRRLMARRVDARGPVRERGPLPGPRVAWLAIGVGLGVVALIGALLPLSAAGAGPAAAALTAQTPADAGSVAGLGGFDLLDLGTKSAVVLGLLFVCLRVLARLQGPARKPGTMLAVLESRPLAAKASLHLVAIGDRRLVVGLTPSGMVSLAELDAAELAGSEAFSDAVATATAEAFGHAARPASAGVMGTALPAAIRPIASLGSLTAPLDAIAGRLASLMNWGRAR
jgi:flagellar biosynthetic protein FliO